MKKFKSYKLASAILCTALFLACNDELELKPFNATESSDAFKNSSSFQNALLGAYRGLLVNASNANAAVNTVASSYAAFFLSTPDVLADNLITNSQGRATQLNFHYWNYTSNTTWATLWSDCYGIAARVNAILANIDNLPDGDFKNNIRGEALALRGMVHFDLVRTFGKAPLFATASDLGVPYVTTADPAQQPPRNTVAETYGKVIEDLEAAKGLVGTTNGVGRFNRNSVNALLSRVYLTMGNWAKVIESANAAIGTGTNLVADMASFPQVWRDASDNGVLLKVINLSPQNNVTVGVQYSQTGTGGVRSEFNPDYSLYQLYTNNDVRRSAYFVTSAFSGFQFNHIAKYFSKATGNANVVDVKLIRWEEVYLNRAEAYANTNQDALALTDLDVIRSNRYTGFVSGGETGQALKDAIALQRRLEFAFEGHRFFDLKRLGLPIQRSSFGDRADGTGVALPANVRTLPASSHFFQLPIPQSEIAANPNIVQNPNY